MDVLEQTPDCVVLREKSHRAIGITFSVFYLLMLAFGRGRPGIGLVFGWIFSLACLTFAQALCFDRTIRVTQSSGVLYIVQRIGRLVIWRREFPIVAVDQVFERRKQRGCLLGIRFLDGRTKTLMSSTRRESLAAEEARLNQLIRAGRSGPTGRAAGRRD